jgi:DNA processing protein
MEAGNSPAELLELLALHLVPGLGPRLTASLLERFGSAANVFKADVSQLSEVPHIGDNLAGKLRQAISRVDVQAELTRMKEKDVTLLQRGVPPYPEPLATIADPPGLLYMRGNLEPRDRQAVAIVGSRNCTSYGRRIAERLAGDLARAGYTIVSGLARGIDACAHRGALQAGGRTLGVLAGGLSKIYPPEHADLAEEVRACGALLTESAMLMEPMAGMFPARNRIISGLTRAVVIVEAADKSGALITASHAAEQGREVFAVPGPVDNPASAGALELLRKGAKLARHAGDILEELHGIASLIAPTGETLSQPVPIEKPPGLDDLQQKIWEFLGSQRQNVDDIARTMNLPVPELTRTLMVLEMKKVIKRLPGNQYERW